MNIFTLAFGLLMLGGALYCLARLLVSLATGRWKHTLKTLAVFFGSLGLICLLMWLGDPYERRSVNADELAGTYKISAAAKQRLSSTGYSDFTGSLTLTANGTCSAIRLPACCVHGDDEGHSRFRGGLCFVQWYLGGRTRYRCVQSAFGAEKFDGRGRFTRRNV